MAGGPRRNSDDRVASLFTPDGAMRWPRIDDLVPLAEAWESGASTWTAVERAAYANDLRDDRALIAVSAASNRSKSGRDLATWQSPAVGYRCTYANDWAALIARWQFAIDPPSRLRSPASSIPARPAPSTSPLPTGRELAPPFEGKRRGQSCLHSSFSAMPLTSLRGKVLPYRIMHLTSCIHHSFRTARPVPSVRPGRLRRMH